METASDNCTQGSGVSISGPKLSDSGGKFSHLPVIRQIERNAERTPDKTALIYNGRNLSYSELISSARQVACGLHLSAIKARSRVAVLMQPCPELVVTLLGIHLRGATYVPIDPDFPPARIAMILEDIAPSGIICTNANLDDLKSLLPEGSVALLRTFDNISECGAGTLDSFETYPTSLDDESHIFFTSGTTGRPKGAISTHQNLSHGMSSSAQCFDLTGGHSILSVAGSSFSISTFELLSLLACGGHTVIANRSDILDMQRLFDIARTVSVWHFVPTLLARLIDYIEQEPNRRNELIGLERILTGGDHVPQDLLRKVRALLPAAKLYVNYGASETNCMVTYWPVIVSEPTKTRIGIAQQNVHLLVLDKEKNPVKGGDIGELFVAGPGVIRGYINREDLDSDKFIETMGQRYFSTGDMVRLDESGLYEMLGREDFQIQLNGNRIELLEVESSIKKVTGIKDCVVAVKNKSDASQAPTLVAYVVVESNLTPSVIAIKTELKKYLPSYMVPSLYLLLDKIPTNHNGKVDRANLPELRVCTILESSQKEAISNSVEQEIADTFSQLLASDSIHANSDFFELGGNSITAVRAVATISDTFNCSLSISDIVSNTTVQKLASLVCQRMHASSLDCDVDDANIPGGVLLKEGNPDIPPLLLINGVVEYLELAKALRTERSIYAIFLPEEIDIIVNGAQSTATDSTSSLTSITQLYLSVIKAIQPVGPYYLAGKSFGGIIAIEIARALEHMDHKIAFIGLLDTVVPDAFTSHKKLSFRIRQHFKRALSDGPGYLFSRIKQRYALKGSLDTRVVSTGSPLDQSLDNIRIRHKVRKNAIFTARLSRVDSPLILIKARDRKHLYGEKPLKDLGWSKYSTNFTVHEVPGDHHSILMSEHVGYVARHIESHI